MIRLFKKIPPQSEVLKETAISGQSDETFEKLIPTGILKLLKIKNHGDLAVGDQQYSISVIMDINTADFSDYVYNRQADQVFSYMNQMFNKVIPIIYDSEGFVESFRGGGLTALYQENYEQAVVAAISICECIHKMTEYDQKYDQVIIGICHGPIMVGVVGHEKRMTILVLSEAEEFAGFLRSIGWKYYAKIIVTADFMEMIEDGNKKFNYRLLGYVYIRTSGTVEKIYDVFDGDEVTVRNRKRKTKMVFEKGVALFREQQTDQARLHFIEVLKMDRSDRAAKEYLLRCDKEVNGQKTENGFLETY